MIVVEPVGIVLIIMEPLFVMPAQGTQLASREKDVLLQLLHPHPVPHPLPLPQMNVQESRLMTVVAITVIVLIITEQ